MRSVAPLGLAAVAAVVAVAATTLSPRTAVAGPPGGGVGMFCQQYAGGHVGEFSIPAGQGACASFVATLGPTICKGTGLFGLPGYELLGFRNQGQCVSTVQQMAREYLAHL